MMTLEMAIQHCHEKAEELKSQCDCWKRLADEKGLTLPSDYEPCLECAKEHEQLAEWLEELQKLRNIMRQIKFNAYAISKWIEEADNDK